MEQIARTPMAPVEAVSLSEVVAALSHALDLTAGQPRGHAGRTCLIGMRLAHDLGLDEAELSSLYYALLLKDSGCASSSARMTEIFGGGDDLALKRAVKLVDLNDPRAAVRFVRDHVEASGSSIARARQILSTTLALARQGGEMVEARCDRGARIIARLGFSAEASDAVRALDEHWDGRGRPRRLKGEEIPLLARIACLAQTVDVFLTAFGRDHAREMVRERSGSWFDPVVTGAFLAIESGDPFWHEMAFAEDPAAVADLEPRLAEGRVDDDDLDRISDGFADVIDAKSPYTFNHSAGVAHYATGIAGALDFRPEEVRLLRRAGLLHDIGKLGISNAILDKPARLSEGEFAQVRLHPLYTKEILSRVAAFAPLADVAAAHHERLDGRGYHLGLTASQLSMEARILPVADAFEAMYANRPYRSGMPVDRILEIMHAETGTAFDGECVEALETHLQGDGLLVRGGIPALA